MASRASRCIRGQKTMAIIEWSSEFELGIAEIDQDHKTLIALINEVHSGIESGASTARVLAVLKEIYRQISGHFADEEHYMREVRYMSYAEHKEDHEILLDDLRDIMEQVQADGGYPRGRLSRDLYYWFSEHFRIHDARLHRRKPG